MPSRRESSDTNARSSPPKCEPEIASDTPEPQHKELQQPPFQGFRESSHLPNCLAAVTPSATATFPSTIGQLPSARVPTLRTAAHDTKYFLKTLLFNKLWSSLLGNYQKQSQFRRYCLSAAAIGFSIFDFGFWTQSSGFLPTTDNGQTAAAEISGKKPLEFPQACGIILLGVARGMKALEVEF